MKDFLKILKWSAFPLVISLLALGFPSYMIWKETSINNHLIEQSLKGNPVAIEILTKYEKPWKLNERLINEALAGNENAIKVLGLGAP